jgi:hypothetical protein
VIDCDTVCIYDELLKAFPDDFAKAGVQRTRTGYHVFFNRTTYADERGVFDNFKLFTGIDHVGDVKTITKTARTCHMSPTDQASNIHVYHTPGILVVYPSANKFWMQLPTEFPDVPDKLVDHLFDCYERGKKKKRVSRGPPRVREVDVHDEDDEMVQIISMGAWTPTYANDATCLAEMGFHDIGAIRSFVREFRGSTTSKFATGCYQFACTVSPCPICYKPTGHLQNTYVVNYKTNGERRVGNFSQSCIPSGRVIDWTPHGMAKWRATLEGTAYAKLIVTPPQPTSMPLEAYLIAPALRVMDATWRPGDLFVPDKTGMYAGKYAALMCIKAGANDPLVGMKSDGTVEVGEKTVGHERYVWRPLSPKATLALDASLASWFAKTCPAVKRDERGLFIVNACADAHCEDVVDTFFRRRAKRAHADCMTRTSRPWAMLKAIVAHERLRACDPDLPR